MGAAQKVTFPTACRPGGRTCKVGGNLPPHPPRVRSAPSPRGEGLRAADSRPYDIFVSNRNGASRRPCLTGIQTQGRRAAQCAAPTARTDRKRWLVIARRSCGIAWPLNFCKPRARRARKESQATTQILRAGNILPDSRDNPRNGGPGVRRIWTRSVHPEPSPGDPQGELARRAKRRWPGPLVSFPSQGKKLAPQGETLSAGGEIPLQETN